MVASVALLGGTGRSGPGLALRFGLAGLRVLIGSRDHARGVAAAAEVAQDVSRRGGTGVVTGHSNSEAAAAAEVVFITVPHAGQVDLLPDLADLLAGKVVVSTAVPVLWSGQGGPVWDGDTPHGCAALEAQALLPAARVVAGFHSLSSAVLARPERGVNSHVIVTGDDLEARRTAMELAELLPGVRAVDAGPLRYAVHSEQLTVLLLAINRANRIHAGVLISDLPER